MNFSQYITNQRNLPTSDIFDGGRAATIAFTLSRVWSIPLSEKTCPINSNFLSRNWHFSLLNFNPLISIFSITALNLRSCSSIVLTCTIMSLETFRTPSYPWGACWINLRSWSAKSLVKERSSMSNKCGDFTRLFSDLMKTPPLVNSNNYRTDTLWWSFPWLNDIEVS